MFNSAWKHIRRSPYQAALAIGVLTLTFFVVSRVILILLVSEFTLRHFESKPQVSFFLKEQVSEKTVKSIIAEIKKNPLVKSVKYVSQDEALKIYRRQNAKDPLLLEMVTANILPASIEISTVKVEDLTTIASSYKNFSEIEEIVFQKDVVENLSRWAKAVRLIGAEHIGAHLLLSLFVIIVIISMKIAMRKEEIEILRLLGASGSYIRTPFILEGMFYGAVSSFLAASAFVIVIISNFDPLNVILTDLNFPSLDVGLLSLYFAITVGLGLILGWFSSLMAVVRFLR